LTIAKHAFLAILSHLSCAREINDDNKHGRCNNKNLPASVPVKPETDLKNAIYNLINRSHSNTHMLYRRYLPSTYCKADAFKSSLASTLRKLGISSSESISAYKCT
jgi:hypothetical protein